MHPVYKKCKNVASINFHFRNQKIWNGHGRRKPFQHPKQDQFSAPLHNYDAILRNQPWNDLLKRKQTHFLCFLYILNLPVRPRQGPLQHPSTKKTFLSAILYIKLMYSRHVEFI